MALEKNENTFGEPSSFWDTLGNSVMGPGRDPALGPALCEF